MNEEFGNQSMIEADLQVRLMNLVMGEASDFERDQLQSLMEDRAELAAYYQHLEHLHGLLREVGAGEPSLNAETSKEEGPWRLSPDCREKLLAVLEGKANNPTSNVAMTRSTTTRPTFIWSQGWLAALAVTAASLLLGFTIFSRFKSSRNIALSRTANDLAALGTPNAMYIDGLFMDGTTRREPNLSLEAHAPLVSDGSEANSFTTLPNVTAKSTIEANDDFQRRLSLNAFDETNANSQANKNFGNNEGFGFDPGKVQGGAGGMGGDGRFDMGRELSQTESLGKNFNYAKPSVVERMGVDFDFAIAERALVPEQSGLSSAVKGMDIKSDNSFGISAGLELGYRAPDIEQPIAANVSGDGTILLGGVVKSGPAQGSSGGYSDNANGPKGSALMETRTPRIIIPEEEEKGVGSVASQPSRVDLNLSSPPVANPTEGDESFRRDPGLFGDVPIEFVDEVGLVIVRGRKADVERTLQEVKQMRQQAQNEALPKSENGAIAPAKRAVSIDEQSAAKEPFSTFSLHVSDVSFKLAQTALSQGQWPDADKIRIEEFVNALDYHDPLPSSNEKVACRVEQAIHPFLIQRNMLRVSMRTAATGRSQNTPLRLTILLDNSGSMERPDRRQTVQRAFQLLTAQLKEVDRVTLISFASTPRLLADKVQGNQGEALLQLIENLPSEGGTNIEAALMLAREKAIEQQLAGAQNRIVLLTDGAVNLGNANPDSLAKLVTQLRDTNIAFDAAGISSRDLNDEILEALTRQGDGRYYLLDSAESANQIFAAQIAGALRPSAQNVKVQVEFNPQRVGRYKLLGFEKHRLNTEDFRNDKVDAAEMAAAEAGVAVYQFEIKPNGIGDVGSVSVRFRDVNTGKMIEHRWPIPYESNTSRLEQAEPSMRLAACAALLAAKLGGDPLADRVDLAELQKLLSNLPEQVACQPRVQQLRAMVDQALTIGR